MPTAPPARRVALSATLSASHSDQTVNRTFTLNITYDDSPQFGEPADYGSNNRWTVAYETYEGLTDLTGISLPWTAVTDGTRQWSPGTPTSITPKCRDHDGDTSANWPAAGEKDSSLFSVTSEATAQSGTATVAFQAAPDYETPGDDEDTDPGDNTYQLRVVATHALHALGAEDDELGCNASAVDITITVKDVGPPVTPTDFTGQFNSDDNKQIDVNWSAPTGFDQNGATVAFPHSSFDVSKYQYRYRWGNSQPWTQLETTTTSAIITGLTKTGYIIQLRAVNSEDNSAWAEIIVGTLENQPPTITRPANAITGIVYKFPDGLPAVATYDDEPGSDPEGDQITYSFLVQVPNIDGGTELANALLTATRVDNNFDIRATTFVTPEEFVDVYGEVDEYEMAIGIYASDGYASSGPNRFTLSIYYEGSAHFDDTFDITDGKRFLFKDAFETYEGPAAASDITIDWSSTKARARSWSKGNPSNQISCTDNAGKVTYHTWPTAGQEDSGKFNAPEASTTARTGSITPVFTTAPDYESPADSNADNLYLVRYYDQHFLPSDSDQPTTPGCSGSAVDVRIKIKDVGTPAPVQLTADFNSTDNSKIDLSWTAPTGFVEDGEIVTFPHTSFNPTSYDYRYRASSSDDWTEETVVTTTSATMTGLTQPVYEIQIRATNSEGPSPWPSSSETASRLAVPEKVAKPTKSTATANSVTIEWTAPDDNGSSITSYSVRHKKTADASWGTPTSTTVTSLEAKSLLPETSYDFQVRATNDLGDGQWSNTLMASTSQLDATASITALTTSVSEGSNARFRIDLSRAADVTVNLTYGWTGDYGTVVASTVTFSSSDTKTISIPTVEGDSTSDGILTVTVTAGNSYTVGAPSSANTTIIRNPTPPSKPDAPTVEALTTTSIRVNWQEPSSETTIDEYQIRHRKTGTPGWITATSPASARTKNITGLKVNASYDVQVLATNADGNSPWSELTTESTLDLAVSIAVVQSSVTEGTNDAQFTITLSRQTSAQVKRPVRLGRETSEPKPLKPSGS